MKPYLLFGLCIVAATNVLGQSLQPQVCAATGGFRGTNGLQLAWTIGEPITTTTKNQNFILTQGFHQPEVLVSSGVPPSNTASGIRIYPNPTTDVLYVALPPNVHDARITLLTLHGQVIATQQASNTKQSQLMLPVEASGACLVRVTDLASGSSTSQIIICRP